MTGASNVEADGAFLERAVFAPPLRLGKASCPELERVRCGTNRWLRIQQNAIRVAPRRSLDETPELLTTVAELLQRVLPRVRCRQRVVDGHAVGDEADRVDEHRREGGGQRIVGPRAEWSRWCGAPQVIVVVESGASFDNVHGQLAGLLSPVARMPRDLHARDVRGRRVLPRGARAISELQIDKIDARRFAARDEGPVRPGQ